MAFTSNYVTCAGREIHYTEWGAQHRRTVIAWHGLARTGRDMDELAQALSHEYRVICPDTLGRGYSQWSPDPGNEYKLEFYARLAADLFDQLGIARAHWVGTSTTCARPSLPGPRVSISSAASRNTRSDSAPRSSSTGMFKRS